MDAPFDEDISTPHEKALGEKLWREYVKTVGEMRGEEGRLDAILVRLDAGGDRLDDV